MINNTIPIYPVETASTFSQGPYGIAGRPKFKVLPPLSLYIHIPWCLKKCPYCDFNSHESHAGWPEAEYTESLIKDLELGLALVWGRKIHSVFFGGGTPSLFSPASIDKILTAVRTYLPLVPGAEVTLEANPGTFEQAKFAEFAAAGVNRLSIGVQSFQPRLLKALGRAHNAEEAHQAIAIAQRFFDNFNIDLMYALPEQTVGEALDDIRTAIDYRPPHISAYQLTLEPNTHFSRYPPSLPEEEAVEDIEQTLYAALANSGYHRYEISAFAKPGFSCCHNQNYWLFGDYLGVGAGAHTKITLSDRILREIRYKNPREYIAKLNSGSAVVEQRKIGVQEIGFEFMLNALRLVKGFPEPFFEERTGYSLALIQEPLQEAIQRKWIRRENQRIFATETGMRFLNEVLERFLV